MPGPTLSFIEVADELGRSTSWLYKNWPVEARERGMPFPLHDDGTLVWSRAQFYAWLDRNLSPNERIAAAAFRAAAAAAAGASLVSDDTTAIDRSRDELNRKLGIV